MARHGLPSYPIVYIVPLYIVPLYIVPLYIVPLHCSYRKQCFQGALQYQLTAINLYPNLA